ncbi:acyl-CoA dehydrogenase family protein [Amycolatopsis sp. NPDC051061]|uniref:acyl-CoA dehydrogenase family protein n=1 Tax=Amycolatopsis sp. NPDC051061 TaxID=3155042 RepID=UPI00341994BD
MGRGPVSSTVLDRVRKLAPGIASRAQEIEDARALPPDLVAELTGAGCFRMLVPRRYGGEELDIAACLDVIEELSTADASTGWSAMIACSNLLVFGLFPQATVDAVYANGPDVVSAGSHAPKGTARPVDGGYVLSGQWPLASGCGHSGWVFVHAAVGNGDEPELMSNGMPVMRLALLPAAEVEIVDTWRALGLRGSGSHDIRVRDVFCPAERTCRLFGGWSTLPDTVFRVPPVAPLALFIAAVAVGAGRAALEDAAEVAAGGKRPAYGARRVAESPLFQTRIAEADTQLRAARALIHAEARQAWHTAAAGGDFSLLDRARMRAASTYAVQVATEATETSFRLAGSGALYDGSALQRRMRDVATLAQHASVGPEFYPIAGALLAGEPVDTMRI